MRPEAVQQARDRLQTATLAVADFRAAKDFAAADRAWTEFLHAMGGVYTKLERGSKDNDESKAWFDSKKDERNEDEMLRYLYFARNADVHGLEPVTEKQHGGAALPFGKHVPVGIQGLDENMQPVGKPDVGFISGLTLVLTRAHGKHHGKRGKEFCDPPRSHKGQALTNPLTDSVTAAALAHAAAMIAEAEALV